MVPPTENTGTSSASSSRYRLSSCWLSLILSIVLCFGIFGFSSLSERSKVSIFGGKSALFVGTSSKERDAVIELLQQEGVYNDADFVNEIGRTVPYWTSKPTTKKPNKTTSPEWGPCFGPHKQVNWQLEIENYQSDKLPSYNQILPDAAKSNRGNPASTDTKDWANYCRPGFLIIGAGKCGTSSLYHYLTDHPRVLPASEKQIHYFKYYATRSMKWYLHHFATATSFLASGSLITGEASPGYLPYPNVAQMVRERLPDGPRIVAIGREPVDRAYSSYRYNYATPTIESMRSGKVRGIEPAHNDSYYEEYLFSFEDMLRAELATLRECLSVPNGTGVAGARQKWGKDFNIEYSRREKRGLEPMVDLDGYCYGGVVNSRVPRAQWQALMDKYPKKVIQKKNVHLKQSMIGRGLYALPLEWWYAVFNPSDIYFMCTEELSDFSGAPMNHLGQFLGLPSYNFSETVSRGAYNVGGHRGYDKEISWTEIQAKQQKEASIAGSGETPEKKEIPLSAAFRSELEDFVRPYNERLFKLVGRRCDW